MSSAGHVFISHGSENRTEANAISDFLEARGIRTWIAPRDVRPGMDYSEQLQSAIETCLAFVVLVTDMANKSPYVRAETEMAFSTRKPIFPVRQSEIMPAAGLAFFLKIRHWTDAYGASADASMDRLARELRTLSGLPEEEAPVPSPSPSPPAPPAKEEAPLPDEDRLRAAIGPNADYYLARWRAMQAKNSPLSWNWPACLANLFWFAYRKLWLPMGAMAFAILLLAALGASDPVLGKVMGIVSILLTFVTGALGNHLYRRQLVALAADPALDRTELAKRGGVSKPAVYVTAGTVFVLTSVVVLTLVIRELEQRKQGPDPALGPALNIVDGSNPPEGVDPAPSGVPAPAPAIDAGLIVGRWTDTNDCGNALEYTADGRVIAPDGSMGVWTLNGDQLTVTGPNGSQTVRITSLDQSAAYALAQDGSVIASQRC